LSINSRETASNIEIVAFLSPVAKSLPLGLQSIEVGSSGRAADYLNIFVLSQTLILESPPQLAQICSLG
jgi:hypothetical protein